MERRRNQQKRLENRQEGWRETERGQPGVRETRTLRRLNNQCPASRKQRAGNSLAVWWLELHTLTWFDAPWKERFDKPRQGIKKQRHYFVDKGPYS